MHVGEGVEVGLRQGVDRNGLADAGVVDQEIDAFGAAERVAQDGLDLIDEPVDGRNIGKIEAQGRRAASQPADLVGHCLAFRPVGIEGQHDIDARPGQGKGVANAALMMADGPNLDGLAMSAGGQAGEIRGGAEARTKSLP